MSTDCSSDLVVGIPLLTAVSEKTKARGVTKYHQDTGEPYTLTTDDWYFSLGNGTYTFKGKLKDDLKFEDGVLASVLEKFDLSIFGYDADYQSDMRIAVIGFSVHTAPNTSCGIEVKVINLKHLQEEMERCRKIFGEIGIPDEPNLFLVTEMM